MPENYEVVYSHPRGATATFVRHDGELDALAKSLDAEQFWVFKNVKSLLVRNDVGDLDEANQLMRNIGFAPSVRVIERPIAVEEPAFAVAPAAIEEHVGPHLPGPSYWPLFLGASATFALGSFVLWGTILPTVGTVILVGIGLVLTFICMIGWGLEPI